jgi:hypothetical protein
MLETFWKKKTTEISKEVWGTSEDVEKTLSAYLNWSCPPVMNCEENVLPLFSWLEMIIVSNETEQNRASIPPSFNGYAELVPCLQNHGEVVLQPCLSLIVVSFKGI